MFDRMKSVPNVKADPVSGVGNEAYYVDKKGAGILLAVRKGGVAFQLKVLNGSKVKPPLPRMTSKPESWCSPRRRSDGSETRRPRKAVATYRAD